MDIIMPQLGETVTEGTVTRWLKQVGDQIAPDELMFEVCRCRTPPTRRRSRAIDGAYASKFLHTIRTIIETRDWEAELS